MTTTYAVAPEVQAKIRRQGLILGGVAVLVTLIAVIRFVWFGLPEDPDVSAVIQQRQSAEEAVETARPPETTEPAAPEAANEDAR